MPKFRVAVLETREVIYEVEASNEEEAGEVAKETDFNDSLSDAHHEHIVNWVEEIE